MKFVEKTYSYLFKKILKAINPLKKRIYTAACVVHKFINNQALLILKNDGYKETYKFMKAHILKINEGVVWADQDMKSSNHFYNPDKDKGLYGNSNAKSECINYYNKSLNEYVNGDVESAMFYLGAACHIIQDLTVPQHANVKLLKSHKSYENWVIRTYKDHDDFKIKKGGTYFDSVVKYIEFNSREAIKAYNNYSSIKEKNVRFHMITSRILTMAQSTTAGLMLKFYNDMQSIKG